MFGEQSLYGIGRLLEGHPTVRHGGFGERYDLLLQAIGRNERAVRRRGNDEPAGNVEARLCHSCERSSFPTDDFEVVVVGCVVRGSVKGRDVHGLTRLEEDARS